MDTDITIMALGMGIVMVGATIMANIIVLDIATRIGTDINQGMAEYMGVDL